MRKKLIFFAGVMLCLILGCWGYYLYQKPRAGVANASIDYSLNASELYNAYSSNETKANELFLNKVLEVKGEVQQVDTVQGKLNLLLAGKAGDGGINCAMVNQNLVPNKGQVVTVKGRCTGYLMDVNLVDVIISQN